MDSAGVFRIAQFPVIEGENLITATATSSSDPAKTTSVSVTVHADFTAPDLDILANGQSLEDEQHFDQATSIDLAVSDPDPRPLSPDPASSLYLDGGPTTPPVTIETTGGHTVLAIATDAAGNQRRIERSFFIGTGGTTATSCDLSDLDPADGSMIAEASTHFAGRTSAPGVIINGVATPVVDGSFCTTVALDTEGANPVTIVCTDAEGTPIGVRPRFI